MPAGSSPEVHDKREEFWLRQITGQEFKSALMICGLAHVLSFAFRLRAQDFSVQALEYAKLAALTPGKEAIYINYVTQFRHDMLRHMRTTINLPDDLVLQAKKAAVEADTTLTEIIENALRESLDKRRKGAKRKGFKVITYGKGALDNTAALLDSMVSMILIDI